MGVGLDIKQSNEYNTREYAVPTSGFLVDVSQTTSVPYTKHVTSCDFVWLSDGTVYNIFITNAYKMQFINEIIIAKN